MKNTMKRELQRMVLEWKNQYPPDDLITTYKDFLYVRETLRLFQFNVNVFHTLLQLTCDSWFSSQRISRHSLVIRSLQYGAKMPKVLPAANPTVWYEGTVAVLPAATSSLLFRVFQLCYTENRNLTELQREECIDKMYRFTRNIVFTTAEQAWLCQQAIFHKNILTRVLHYPQPSAVISAWAVKEYANPAFAHRRAELASWVIDENPDFEITMETLGNDLMAVHTHDIAAVDRYETELEANELIQKNFAHLLPQHEPDEFGEVYPKMHIPTMELKGKYIEHDFGGGKRYPVGVPDLGANFLLSLHRMPVTQLICNMWAITYSRLPVAKKVQLLKKYHAPTTLYSMQRICQRLKSIELAEWLLAQAELSGASQ
ncbi:MAG: hypothetical protein EAY72_01705 [Bacteroidetes bacterium]|nr:MAG: hypothetical protein EAY72_01705 [Bacteroidota bacterium]